MSDTGKVNLPGLPAVSTGNASLDRWIQAVSERLEVREGARGNAFERVVTWRDLQALGISDLSFTGGRGGMGMNGGTDGVLVQQPNGSYNVLSIDEFGDKIRSTRLYGDLMKRLDDPSRFDIYPEAIRAILKVSLADEAAKRGADIQRLDQRIQSEVESLAFSLQEVTASVAGANAGVRELTFASATNDTATAGVVTQLLAALDGTGSATAEESLIVIADRTAGLSSQYMLKLNAGKAVTAVGLMATEDPGGVTESKFIVQADQFALTGTYTYMQGDASSTPPVTPPSAAVAGETWYNTRTNLSYRASGGVWTSYTQPIPFGVDMTTNTTYINGQLRIGSAGGTALEDIVSGVPGNSAGVAYAYKRSATDLIAGWSPTTNGPGAVTWTFASGSITTPGTDALSNGWTKAIPTGTDPLYVSVASAAGAATTDSIADTEWATPVILARDGAGGTNGLNVATAILYQRNSSATVGPTAQANTVTLTFSTGAMTGMSAGWTATIPSASAGAYLWVTRATASAAGTTDTMAAGEWSAPVLYTQDGAAGSGVTATASSQVFAINNAGTATPSTVTVSLIRASAINGTEVNGSFVWSVVSGTFTSSLSTVNSSTGAFGSFSPSDMTTDSVTFRCTYTVATAGSLYLGKVYTDDITVVKVRQGVGISVFLTNESQTLPADVSGNVTSWSGAGGTFKVYSGTTDVTTSCTFAITGNPNTVTASIGAGTGIYSATAAGSWSAGSGTTTITFTATYVHPVTGSQSFSKVFTLTKAKAGSTGSTGSTGAVGVRGTITTKIATAWNATTAWNAINAIAVAAGSTPTYPIKGDIVSYVGGANECTVAGTATVGSGTWGAVAAYIDGSLIVTGTVGATTLSATAIDGKTITGAVIRTATSGARVSINETANTLICHKPDGTTGFSVSTSTGTANVNSYLNNDGLVSTNLGSGIAIKGDGFGTGYGGSFSGNGTRAPLTLGSLTASPSSGANGDMYCNNSGTVANRGLYAFVSGAWVNISKEATTRSGSALISYEWSTPNFSIYVNGILIGTFNSSTKVWS